MFSERVSSFFISIWKRVMRIRWKCNCSKDTVPVTSLNLCPNCHLLSCDQCQLFEPVVKYCAQCLNVPLHNDQLTCHKNCFECPRCNMPLDINSKKDDGLSRMFVFKCAGCMWIYSTPKMSPINSLSKYIESRKEEEDPVVRRFKELEQHYAVKRHLLNWDSSLDTGKSLSTVSVAQQKYLLQRLTQEKLYELINEQCPSKMCDCEEDGASSVLPQPAQLRCKYEYACPSCHECLTKPNNNPKSSKNLKDSVAIDYIPRLQILPLSRIRALEHDETKLALVLTCPKTQGSMQITVSGSGGLYIPINEVTLVHDNTAIERKNDSELHKMEVFASTVPTYQLKADTKLSRMERTRRLGVNPEKVYSTSNDSTSSLIEDPKILDQGNGWCIVPLSLLQTERIYNLQIKVTCATYKITLHCILEM